MDWTELADRWRVGYGPAMNLGRTCQLPWTKFDDLHHLVDYELLDADVLTTMSEAEWTHLNKARHRIIPRSETGEG